MSITEDDAILAKWASDFREKNAGLRCPHHEDHEDWYEIVDLHSDGYGGFGFHIKACCDAFEMLVRPMVTEERLYNPPTLTTT